MYKNICPKIYIIKHPRKVCGNFKTFCDSFKRTYSCIPSGCIQSLGYLRWVVNEICNDRSVQNDSNTCRLGYGPWHCRRFQFSTINNKNKWLDHRYMCVHNCLNCISDMWGIVICTFVDLGSNKVSSSSSSSSSLYILERAFQFYSCGATLCEIFSPGNEDVPSSVIQSYSNLITATVNNRTLHIVNVKLTLESLPKWMNDVSTWFYSSWSRIGDISDPDTGGRICV